MQLKNSITLICNNNTFALSSIDPIWIDDSFRKVVFAKLHPSMKLLVLWKGEEYDTLGDWTQNQAENRIIELLGEDQQSSLQNLLFT